MNILFIFNFEIGEVGELAPPASGSAVPDIHNLCKCQVYVAHSFWVICRNISRTIIDLCTQIWPQEINTISGVHIFCKSSFFSLES